MANKNRSFKRPQFTAKDVQDFGLNPHLKYRQIQKRLSYLAGPTVMNLSKHPPTGFCTGREFAGKPLPRKLERKHYFDMIAILAITGQIEKAKIILQEAARKGVIKP